MQITKYGIVLKSLAEDDLEMVKDWRNADHVRLNMKYQELITSEMQQTWFKQLNKKLNHYFIISKDYVPIGIVNLKGINFETLEAEAGIFIGDEQHLNTLTPILATITIMEFAFNELKLKTLKAQIASSNVKAILFNESIGYKKIETNSESDFQYYTTKKELFIDATKNIRGTLDKLNYFF